MVSILDNGFEAGRARESAALGTWGNILFLGNWDHSAFIIEYDENQLTNLITIYIRQKQAKKT